MLMMLITLLTTHITELCVNFVIEWLVSITTLYTTKILRG